MKLIVINSNSAGNAYALDTGSEILLLEAGIKMPDVKRAIDFRLNKVVGCLTSHRHADHAKYATEYSRFGVKVYGCQDLADNKQFAYEGYKVLQPEKTARIGSFSVVPFHNNHDVEIYGYLIRHKDMGTLLFSTDSYKIGKTIRGIDHFLIEANYSDELLKQNVWNGKVDKAQADRIMLSHMSLEYCIKYLQDCKAENAKTITLCHLSERNSDPDLFCRTVASAFAVPTFWATKGTIVNLNKETI